MNNIYLTDHPLIQHKLSYLRHQKTGPKEFRVLVEEITILLMYNATAGLSVIETEFETPVSRARGKTIMDKVAFITVMRAGQGMLSGAMKLLPGAKVGHVGIYREHDSLEPVRYYSKLPSGLGERQCIILDPLLATGGTANEVVNIIKEEGAEIIKFICIIASPEGLNLLLHNHPEIEVYLAAVDNGLNADGYIVPGLGDAGDRLFGTSEINKL